MSKHSVKISSFYTLDGTTGDFDETVPYEVTVKPKRLRAIEDIMDPTRRVVKSKHSRTMEDVMNSVRPKEKENHFRSIVDVLDSCRTIQSIENDALESTEEDEGEVKIEPFRAKVDNGKQNCLEQEKEILQGSIHSFMAVMNKVLGPRRCTPWEGSVVDSIPWGGSVVDSIVGVFLTQNVSDNLSSSAFMSLASKFPAKSEVSSFTTEDFVSTDMPNDNRIIFPTYMELLAMQELNASNNETKKTQSLTTLLYYIDPSLSANIHPLSVPILGAQLTDGVMDFHEARVDRSKINKPSCMIGKKKTHDFEGIRKKVIMTHKYEESVRSVKEILDLESIRQANLEEISEPIVERGMSKVLGERIKDFLNGLVTHHGRMELEWLRHIDQETAKDYLLRIKGLGLKSVECVRLLTLHHKAFPVDTNVRRICVRLGWVPLQPLPESLQFHLLEQYPPLDNMHKYLWPRLCDLDHQTLYKLHYQMITFGKVFCTKTKPKCNACPLRAECRHFASALSSAKLAPRYPVPEQETELTDIEDCGINNNQFTQNRKNYMEMIEDANMSSALVALMPDAGFIPTPKLKNVSRLRTAHQAYELPYNSPLLKGFDKAEPDVIHPYLLCILNPGETAQSSDTPKIACKSHGKGELCESNACVHCNGTQESQDQKIRGTILIPHRVAVRRMFPLDGTYFQVNEFFADHATSKNPIIFPRGWIDNPKTRKFNIGATRTVYFGTSVPTIYRGLGIRKILRCFWRGSVCLRAFDRNSRAPRPLHKMFHLPSGKGKMSPVEKNKKFIPDLPDKLPTQKKQRSSRRLGS